MYMYMYVICIHTVDLLMFTNFSLKGSNLAPKNPQILQSYDDGSLIPSVNVYTLRTGESPSRSINYKIKFYVQRSIAM